MLSDATHLSPVACVRSVWSWRGRMD